MTQHSDAASAQRSGRYWVPEWDPDLIVLGGVRVFHCRSLDTGDEAIVFVPPKPLARRAEEA